MRWIDVIAKGAGLPVDLVIRILNAGAGAVPDAGPEVQAAVAKILGAASPVNLLLVSKASLDEVLNDVAKGKIDGLAHPDSAI